MNDFVNILFTSVYNNYNYNYTVNVFVCENEVFQVQCYVITIIHNNYYGCVNTCPVLSVWAHLPVL